MWRVRDRLYLGDYESGERALAGVALPLAPGGLSAPFAGVVSLCEVPLFGSEPLSAPACLETQWLLAPIADGGAGQGEFEAALRLVLPFVRRRLEAGNVLVHCAAGMSRSVSVVAALLCEDGLDPDAAFEHVALAKASALALAASDAALLIAPAREFRACLSRLYGSRPASLDDPADGGT